MLFLVVDDDELSRELLTVLLEVEGYEVEVAASGDQALASLELKGRTTPDVVLADIQMPGLTGEALAKELRSALIKMQGGADSLLFAMSGSQPEAEALASFNGFLLKPFKISDLRSMVASGGRPGEPGSPRDEVLNEPVEGDDILSTEIFDKLAELMPIEQLVQMYELCVDDALKRIAHMKLLAEAGDDVEFRKEAHAVKGGSGMIGATELYTLAAAAEGAGLGTSSVTVTLDRLSLACQRLERILEKRTRT